MESLSKCIKKTFLVTQMYTKIHSHKHKITQLTWICLVHTCNIWTFDIVTVWSLLRLSANWWVHEKHISIISNSLYWLLLSQWHSKIVGILWELLSISTAQLLKNSMFYIGFVKMLQWNPVGVIFFYTGNNLLGKTLYYSLMLLDPRCLQSFTYYASLLWLQL